MQVEMGVGHYFMQVIHMSNMYNKQRDELHISVYMKDICIIMESDIMHVYFVVSLLAPCC